MMMLKRDMFRALKSIYIQIGLILTVFLSVLFTFFVGNGDKIGISIFGQLTTYKNLSEVVLNGLDYSKGLGVLVTFIIALFIAQEYQYNTWQHYICSGKNRIEIYIERYMFAIFLSIGIFLLYVLSFYITSILIGNPFEIKKIISIVGRGIIVYTALASIVVFISMSFKNYISSILVSLGFILFEKDIISMIITLAKKIKINRISIDYFSLMKINHAAQLQNISLVKDMLVPCIFLMMITTFFGYYNFSKHEL